MKDILLHLGSSLIIIGFVYYFILIFINRNKEISKDSSFDYSKNISSEYNTINIIESKSKISYYNLKRHVIKLSNSIYSKKDASSIGISLFEVGISIIDNKKNKFLNIIKKIISNIKLLYILPIISIVINYSSYNLNDAKTSIIIISLFLIIMYFIIDIKTKAYNEICDSVEEDKIIKFMNQVILIDKMIFLGELSIIIRMITILLNI